MNRKNGPSIIEGAQQALEESHACMSFFQCSNCNRICCWHCFASTDAVVEVKTIGGKYCKRRECVYAESIANYGPVKHVEIHRAQDGGAPVKAVSILIHKPLPSDFRGDAEGLDGDACDLANALLASLPGGTVDRLLAELLRRKASMLHVPHRQPDTALGVEVELCAPATKCAVCDAMGAAARREGKLGFVRCEPCFRAGQAALMDSPPERHDPGMPHLIDGEFQSDKYPTTPRGFVPLKVTDPSAQVMLWEYAKRHRSIDENFSNDLQYALLVAGYAPPKNHGIPHIVCLVGSRSMVSSYREVAQMEMFKGNIVLTFHGLGIEIFDVYREPLNQLCLRQIDVADEVIVINFCGYVGEFTAKAIEYAELHGKPIRWLEEPKDLCTRCRYPLGHGPDCDFCLEHASAVADLAALATELCTRCKHPIGIGRHCVESYDGSGAALSLTCYWDPTTVPNDIRSDR